MLPVSGMPVPLARVMEQLSSLPGIGPKTAMRLSLSLLNKSKAETQALSQVLFDLHEQMGFCPRCGCFAEKNRCMLCDHPKRDGRVVCVVEQAVDVLMLERGHGFSGVYHVLHGRLNPMDGVGVAELNIDALDRRLADGAIQELILATSATVDGEATAHFIANRYQDSAVQVSRIARGVPEGGELEYLDEYTLARALEQRVLWDS